MLWEPVKSCKCDAVTEAGHPGAGEETDVAFVAKDAKGFQKSLGGDVFTAAWARAGDDEPATHGTAPFMV